MAIEKLVDLKTTVKIEKSRSVITHKFVFPFIDGAEQLNPMHTVSYKDVLTAYSDVIIVALEARMNACLTMLLSNMSRIIHSDENRIVFEKESGKRHAFNHPGFKAMEEAVELISTKDFDAMKKYHYDQIVKALFWVEKPADRENISFGNLISCLMELIVCGE